MTTSNKNITLSGFETMMVMLDKILTAIESVFSGLGIMICCVTVLYNVFMRYVLQMPNTAGEEIARYSSILCVYMGISMGIRSRSHLGIDSARDAFPGKGPLIVKAIADIVTLSTFLFLAVLGYGYVQFAQVKQQFSAALQIPLYMLYAVMFTGFVLCSIRAAMLIWNDFFSKSKPLGDPWKGHGHGGDSKDLGYNEEVML